MFILFTGISRDRPVRIAKYFIEQGCPRPENRGGARKTSEYDEKKAAIVEHISTFTCRASHYTRRGTPGRKYLPSDMSVKQMHAMFARQNDAQVQVTYSLYYSVFCYKFNLGFGHPVTDVCATCASYKLHCKDQLAAEEDRRREAASYILHRRRARVFYDMLNATDEASITVCFDMMQNLSLPKTPIGLAYYSRQLSMYVFGVVVHHGRGGGQSKEDVHLYVWQENENRKDSNMVASALNDCLRHRLPMLNDAGSLRLFSDSCFGQNKNMNMLAMLFALRKQCFPRINIKYVFPVRGHSYLPADRVFGRIEQQLRNMDTVLLPSDYHQVLKNHGTVHLYGEDWRASDYRAATARHTKVQRSFRISDARIIDIDGDAVGMKDTYNGATVSHSVLKRGKNWSTFAPAALADQSTVSSAKKTDVRKLLSAMGVSDAVTTFYENILADTNDTVQSDSGDE